MISIRTRSFYDCNEIISIELPSTIDSIGNYSFHDCSSLENVIIHRTTPPVIISTAFDEVDLTSCTLNVPCQCENNYNSVAPWSQFGSIVAATCQVTLSLSVNFSGRGTVSGGGNFAIGTPVVAVASPAADYFFGSWSDGDTTNPRVVVMHSDVDLMAMFFSRVHDTTYETIVLNDTTYITTIQNDTTYVAYPVHDTVSVHDTAYVNDTIYVSISQPDTVYVIGPQHDTIYVPFLQHDTVFVPIVQHDTVFESNLQHDTIYVPYTLHDTIYVPYAVHDTVAETDTVQPILYQLQVMSADASRGVGVGSCIVPAGTEIEIAAIPYEGYRFAGWLDGGEDNPRRVMVNSNQNYVALFAEVPHSSVTTSVSVNWSASVNGQVLTVNSPATERIRIVDMQGRILNETIATADRTIFVLPNTGAYLVQVGNSPARKFVTQ